MNERPRRNWRSCLAIVCITFGGLSLIGAYLQLRHRQLEEAVESASGQKDVPDLIKALQSSDYRLREQAATAVSRIGPPAKAAVPALLEALDREDYPDYFALSNREAIVQAIGDIGPEAKDSVPKLSDLLVSVDRHVPRDAVIVALGQIGPAAEETIPLLNKELERFHPNKRHVYHALANVGSNSAEVAATIRGALGTFDAKHAAAALVEMGPLGTRVLNSYVGDRFDAIDAIYQNIEEEWNGENSASVRAAMEMIQLSRLGDPAVPFLKDGLNDDREAVRVICAKCLANQATADEKVITVLNEALQKPWFRRSAANYLKKIDQPATGKPAD